VATTALAVLFGLMGVVTVAFSVGSPGVDGLPRGFRKPVLALEMTQSTSEVRLTRALFPGGDTAIQRGIVADFAVIIPAYAVLFIGFALLARARGIPGWGLLITAVLLAAMADIRENIAMLESRPAFFPAAIKWVLLGICMMLMCVILGDRGGLLLVPAAVCLSAAIGLIGGVWLDRLLEPAFVLMGISWFMTAFFVRRL
jgi:hypothetical protein